MNDVDVGNQVATPIEKAYWVIPGQFLAGAHPEGKRLKSLLEAGINTFMDLTIKAHYADELMKEARKLNVPDPEYFSFPIVDRATPDVEYMRQILATLETSLEAGRKVFLHCADGSGRTGTVVGCYLVSHGFAPEKALEQIVAWRVPGWGKNAKNSPETEDQINMVINWAQFPPMP